VHRRTNAKTFSHARDLRHNMTEAEQKLWQAIRYGQMCGVHFRRQHAIGPYIADFCAPTKKLIQRSVQSRHGFNIVHGSPGAADRP
jgi:very-short-patch-repair endonuclease